jgi:Ca2+-binding RTX toxin-like protein
MIGGPGDDLMRGAIGADNGDGGRGHDRIYGGETGDSTLYGGAGGVDLVFGGPGNDACLATVDGSGNDSVSGGLAPDHYFIDDGDAHTGAEIEGPCFAE